jgi:hypothetical protein
MKEESIGKEMDMRSFNTAVVGIPYNWKSKRSKVHPNLMGSPCEGLSLQQRIAPAFALISSKHSHMSMGRITSRLDHLSQNRMTRVSSQRSSDVYLCMRKVTYHLGEIVLFNRTTIVCSLQSTMHTFTQ